MGLFTQIMAILGGFIAFFGVLGASGAPQEASAAAIGVACAVIPYVFVKMHFCRKVLEHQEQIIKALSSSKQ